MQIFMTQIFNILNLNNIDGKIVIFKTTVYKFFEKTNANYLILLTNKFINLKMSIYFGCHLSTINFRSLIYN
jgi:hypothetical protein